MYPYYDTATTTSTPTVVYTCACNVTSCGHHAVVQVLVRSVRSAAAEGDKPPPPRPWIQKRVPVVPSFRNPSLPPWRPRQQRARDGI